MQKFSSTQIIVLSVMALAGVCLICLGVYILFAPATDTDAVIDLTQPIPETQVPIETLIPVETLVNIGQPTATEVILPSETETPSR
jgi:hypothetical protein